MHLARFSVLFINCADFPCNHKACRFVRPRCFGGKAGFAAQKVQPRFSGYERLAHCRAPGRVGKIARTDKPDALVARRAVKVGKITIPAGGAGKVRMNMKVCDIHGVLLREDALIIMKGAACVNAGYTNATKACILFHGRGGKKNHPCGKEVPLAEFVPYLIVCPLVFIAGFVDAVAGGGGLISLPAYLISGIPVHMAIGTNKLSSGMGTALATFRYARSGYVPWKLAAFCAVCALIGSACGAELALLIGDGVFKIIMLVILPLVALYVLRGKALASDTEKEPLCAWKTTAISMAVALIVGAYDGFYGPGTGTFLILLLTGPAHLCLAEANGIAKVINLSTNIAALTVYLFNGKVIFPLGLTAGCFSIAGNYIGTRFFAKGGAKSVKPIILIVLAIFFIKVLTEVLQ